MSTEQIIELLEKVIVPIVTGIIGFFAGSHIERRKYNSKIKNNSSTVTGDNNIINQGNIINK